MLVIFFCSVYLFVGSCSTSLVSLPAAKSEISECHFLLKHSYIDATEGSDLLQAAAEGLRPYLSAERDSASPLLSKDATEEQAWQELESLLEEALLVQTELSKEDLVYIALEAMVESLNDPFTRAMDPEAYAKFQAGLQSQPFGGVGLQLARDESDFVVSAVLADTPAEKAGIEPGDLLLSVQGQKLAVATVKEAEALLAGEIGTRVDCRFSRSGAGFSRTLERVALSTRSVRCRVVPLEDGLVIGWITIENLTDSTGSELGEQLLGLHTSQPVGLILDLRENMGGYVKAALEVSSCFLEPGLPSVKISSRSGTEVKTTLGQGKEIEGLPLLVLVNARTASSAEIIAACLQDYRRAILVGQKTFGKGSVQSLHEFDSGGGVKFTVARYTSPKGRVIDGKGLEPDLKLEEHEILPHCKKIWTARNSP